MDTMWPFPAVVDVDDDDISDAMGVGDRIATSSGGSSMEGGCSSR